MLAKERRNKMTNEEGHRLLWTVIAREGMEKEEVWEELGFNKSIIDPFDNCCFACIEAGKIFTDEYHGPDCPNCPIDWGAANCEMSGTLYNQWETTRDKEKEKELALKISQLSWKKPEKLYHTPIEKHTEIGRRSETNNFEPPTDTSISLFEDDSSEDSFSGGDGDSSEDSFSGGDGDFDGGGSSGSWDD
jgi:uncharacterized membrane protein YgcG